MQGKHAARKTCARFVCLTATEAAIRMSPGYIHRSLPAVRAGVALSLRLRSITILRAFPAVVLVVCCLSCLIGIHHPIQNVNEGVYARVAQAMLETRQWLVPTLNGVPYLEKPPLLYWVTAAAYALFGTSEAATRAAPIVGAGLVLTAAFWFARRRLSRDAAVWVAPIIASAPITIVMTRTLMFDMLFTGLFTWALLLLYEALQQPAKAYWLRASWAVLGLAVMTKGLAALALFGAIALAYLAFAPGPLVPRLRALLDPIAFALLLLVAAPWHIAASAAEPGFAWFYFVNEHLLRFVGRRFPADYHAGAWWYYLPRLVGYLFPWTMLLALMPFRRVVRAPAQREPTRFLWIAFLVPLLVFSCSRAKGNYYMLVAMPALALILADWLARAPTRLLAIAPLSALVTLACAIRLGPEYLAPYRVPPEAFGAALACALLLVGSLAGYLTLRPVLGTLLCACATLPAIVVLDRSFNDNERLGSARSLAACVRGEDEIYVYRQYEDLSALAVYLDRDVGVVASRSADLWYGARLRPQGGSFVSIADVAERARTGRVTLIVVDSDLGHFERSGLAPLFVVRARIGRDTVFESAPASDSRPPASAVPATGSARAQSRSGSA
jgi:4-amino-4-deoxy-L-arabinose transferase-like glycosyltransferase